MLGMPQITFHLVLFLLDGMNFPCEDCHLLSGSIHLPILCQAIFPQCSWRSTWLLLSCLFSVTEVTFGGLARAFCGAQRLVLGVSHTASPFGKGGGRHPSCSLCLPVTLPVLSLSQTQEGGGQGGKTAILGPTVSFLSWSCLGASQDGHCTMRGCS
jgi:hypothetical protein